MQTRIEETNENTTLIEVELCCEELEEVIAPKLGVNHNEQFVSDKVKLSVEEVEEMIAPGVSLNHNETLRGRRGRVAGGGNRGGHRSQMVSEKAFAYLSD